MTGFFAKAALLAVTVAFSAVPKAFGEIGDYEFQLVSPELKKANGAVVEVRLVNKRSGQPVPNAIIMAKRIDMAPDGMATMDSPLERIPAEKPGHYRFKTDLTMVGRWQLSLGAKVQGETGTVQSRLVLKAVD